jgi:hypothetical protein
MLQVASDTLYLEMFQRFFRHRLLQLSVHPSANFVIQALIASARHPGQVCCLSFLQNSTLYYELFSRFILRNIFPSYIRVRIMLDQIAFFRFLRERHCRVLTNSIMQVTMILEELESSFAEILAERRGTVVGALLAACLRFRIKQREVL